jgi:isopentenyldiphosphate isomerase
VDELVERVDDQDRGLGVVSRRQAIRERWLHRVAVTVCRDEHGRILVHWRSEQLSRFPGLYEVTVGGGVDVVESYERVAGIGTEVAKRWPAGAGSTRRVHRSSRRRSTPP